MTRIYKYRQTLKDMMYSRKGNDIFWMQKEKAVDIKDWSRKRNAGGGLVGKVTSCCIPLVPVK